MRALGLVVLLAFAAHAEAARLETFAARSSAVATAPIDSSPASAEPRAGGAEPASAPPAEQPAAEPDAATGAARPRSAASSAGVEPAASPAPEAPSPFLAWVDDTLHSTLRWEDGSPRLFFAEQLDAGYVYVRGRSFIGYGKPHDRWIGLEVTPMFWMGALSGFVGLSGAWRWAGFRAGARPVLSLDRAFLPAADSHQRLEFDTAHGSAKYVALEAELSANLPLGPGVLQLLGSLTNVQGVPEGLHVFEEGLRIMVAPPWVWRARGGYALHVVRGKQHSVGLVVDVMGVPARNLVQVRVGVVGVVKLSTRLEARLSIIPAVYSRDQLGFLNGELPELGIRYTFATGK
ncbi:MAG: hypothetical protein AB1938_10005 [Myxococcota bacterium]